MTLIRRAYTVCWNDNNHLQEKLHLIEMCFTEINGYPKFLLKQTFDSFETSEKTMTAMLKTKTTTIRI